jgi:hypothetical protein
MGCRQEGIKSKTEGRVGGWQVNDEMESNWKKTVLPY